ncbi:MAG: C40 family peptidase [Thermoleophilia bacterium]|nr:C40 family peptidase [Thermoleophilia bacterium]
MIAAEEARKRAEAERQKQAALAAQRAAAAREAAVRSAAPSAPSAPSSPASQAAPSAPSAPASAPAAGPAGSTGQQAVSIAMRYLGVPYVWGGASPSGFDCSGLASYVYGQLGISVPHYTGAIWGQFPKVSSGDLQPGDLVFFYSDLHHMGIYIGNGQFIHAPHTGDVVKITPLSDRAGSYAGAVRPY